MSLAIAQSPLAAPLDLGGFIPAGRAAEILGIDADSYTRKCRTIGAAAGWAAMALCPETGQMRWWVNRSIDPRFAAGEQGESSISELEKLSGKQRELALQRADCAKRYRHERLHSPDRKEIWLPRLQGALGIDYPKLGKLSCSTLAEWDKKSDGGKNVVALADRRGGHQAPEASPEAWKCFADLFLHQNQPAARHCWKIVRRFAGDNGWRWVSYSQCRRQLNKKISPEKQAFFRTPEKHRQQLDSFLPQHPESWRANQRWVSDHKQLDLWCMWRGSIIRPWLTAWMDWRTRRIVGWILSDCPSSSTILGSLGKSLRNPGNLGGPAEVVTDNGRDFASYAFHGSTKQERRSIVSPRVDEQRTRGIFGLLGIEAHFANPFSPNGKSRCERFFGNLTAFAREFPTFCGIDSETKPERLNEILSDPANIPTFEAVESRLVGFIAEHNASADHGVDDLSENGVKLSPNEAFSRWADTRRVMADPEVLNLLLAIWHKPVTMGRNGLALTIGGRLLRYGHTSPQLRDFKALSKKDRPILNVSYDPDHLESVRVYDADFRFVCIAEMNAIGGSVEGVTKADQVAVHKKMAAYRKARRHVAEYAIDSLMRPEEQVATEAMRRQLGERQQRDAAAAASAAPLQIKLVQTPLDGELKHIRREEMRREFAAAGSAGTGTAAANPFALLRKNQTNKSTDAPMHGEKKRPVDGFALLRRRYG